MVSYAFFLLSPLSFLFLSFYLWPSSPLFLGHVCVHLVACLRIDALSAGHSRCILTLRHMQSSLVPVSEGFAVLCPHECVWHPFFQARFVNLPELLCHLFDVLVDLGRNLSVALEAAFSVRT
ncbi:unnamed protein product [Protopolystoma xenopodis]|uniref:Uncharacterized protein n=1 Tax=Protopolystoma xenopodis TaxID=117903 RepID=A0A448WXN0_9PLAT|nr:unnamed protein product [Protopolystoma xenopodis]